MDRILFTFLLVSIRRRASMHNHYSCTPDSARDPAAVLTLLLDHQIPLPISPIEHRLLQAAYDGHPIRGLWRLYGTTVIW